MGTRLYNVVRTRTFISNFERLKKCNAKLVERVYRMLGELAEHPQTGIGKPERLKYKLSGFWSRRIDDEHRLIYRIFEEEKKVRVYHCYGHYINVNLASTQ